MRLTFGCRSSPHIFNSLSEALCWILLNVCKLTFVLHLLDDFLLIDFPSSQSSILNILKQIFSDIGVPLSAEKTLGPSTSLEFLGISLDTVKMQASLPQEKLLRIRSFLESFSSIHSVSKRDMLSLLGHLNFAMSIIPQGRAFISRLLTLAHSVQKLSDPIQIDDGCLSDIKFWTQLLNDWNGISFFTMKLSNHPQTYIYLRMPPHLSASVLSFKGNGLQRNGQTNFLRQNQTLFLLRCTRFIL